MSLARIRFTAFLLLLLALCNAETTGSGEIKVNDSSEHSFAAVELDTLRTDTESDAQEEIMTPNDDNDDNDDDEEEDKEEMDLPILPPIILLDFDNDTQNDNVTDEKSKRTVNNALGYGFERNALQTPRKYNYYFPAGKTGTTVSIEESISPFLPHTIIEKVPASKLRSSSTVRPLRQENRFESTSIRPSAHYHYHSSTTTKPIFGLRTKLTKVPEQYGGFSPIARPSTEQYVETYRGEASTTPSVLFASTGTPSYVTARSPAYASSSEYSYVTPSPQSYVEVQRYQSGQHAGIHSVYKGYSRPTQAPLESSTSFSAHASTVYVDSRRPPNYGRPETSTPATDINAGPFAGLPRYTVENGIRYENKIFWKYPDGRVSDVPPMTYETYSEYPSLAALQADQSRLTSSDVAQLYESGPTENNVLAQGPVQFPMAPESDNSRNTFDSLSTLSQQHAYRLRYQSLVGKKPLVPQRSKAGTPAYAVSSTTAAPLLRTSLKSNVKNNRHGEPTRRPVSKYMVNSPNPEYVESFTTESAPRSTPPGSFGLSGGSPTKKTPSKNLDNYSNLQYTDLLNYNPSISQYIKNPASILNVQPTFVQAGSSLIPVIILRVDGVPPIQPKASPNVNLKALLQQYLVQYAKSVEELARPSTFDFGNDQSPRDQATFATNSLRELVRLAQTPDRPNVFGNPRESYIGKSSYETSNLDVKRSPARYGERTASRPKVKSVQIVDDPRFAGYRAKN